MTALFHAYTQTVADGTATSVVRPSDWNSAHIQAQMLSGNYAGPASITGTNIVFQGGSNITLSASTGVNAATIIFDAATNAQTQQPMYFSASGTNTSANTMQFGNTNGVSFSLSNGSVVATVATNYMASDQGSNFVATSQSSLFQQTSATSAITSAALNTSQSSLFQQTSATSAITSAAFPSANTTKFAGTGFTSAATTGTAVLATHGTDGLSMAIPPYITTYDATSGRAGLGFTSTTTAGTAIVATQSTNGLSMAVPAFITTYANDLTSGRAGTGYTSTTTAGTAVVGTLNTNGLSLGVPAYITTYVNDLTSGRAGTGYTSTTTAGTAVVGTLNTNGLSLGVPAYITTYANDLTSGRAGTGFSSTTTAGTAVVGTLNTNGLSLGVPAYITTYVAQTVQTQNLHNVTLSGNTSGTLAQVSSGTLTLAGGNNITLSQVGNAITISGVNTVAQTVDTNKAGTGYTSTTQAGSTVGVTLNTSGLSAAWPPFITTYANDLTSGRAGTGFTSTTTAGTAITAALGTNGLSMAVPAFVTTYDATSGRAGTGTTLATTNISATLAANTNGIALSLNAMQDDFNGWNLVGNTAGTTSTLNTTVGNLYFSGGSNITLSGNSNTIVISGGGGSTINQTGPSIGVSNLGNTSGSTGTVSTGNVVFAGGNGILLSQSTGAAGSNATITIAEYPLYAWANNLYLVNSQTIQPRQSTSVVFPGLINNAVSFDHIRLPLTVSMNSTTVATTANTTFSLGVFYTFDVRFFTTNTANATSLGSALSTSAGMTHQISAQANTAGSQYTITHIFTYPFNAAGGTSSFSTSYAASTSNLAFSTSMLTQFTGMKHLELAMASSLPANLYWIAYGVSSTTSTQGVAGISTNFLIHSNWGMSQPNNTWGFFGQANNASVQAITGVGSITTAAGALTGFGFSNVSSSASHVVPYVYMEFDG